MKVLQFKMFLLLILFPIPYFLGAQNSKEERFKTTVYDVIRYYNNKESERLNELIQPKVGCYVLSTPGAQVCWQHTIKLPLNDNCVDEIIFPVPINYTLLKQKLPDSFKLKYTEYPKINGEYPSASGLFVDTTNIRFLEQIASVFLRFMFRHPSDTITTRQTCDVRLN